MAIGGGDKGCGEEGQLPNESQDPDCKVYDVRPLLPVEQREEDVQVKETGPNDVNL